MRRKTFAIGLALASSLLLTGCADGFVWSEDAQAGTKSVVCASVNVLIGQIKTGGAVARTAAVVIRDNSSDETTKALAQQIIDGNADAEVYEQLTAALAAQCT